MGRLDVSAVDAIKAAGEGGCPDAEYDIALMYATGHGAPQDNVLAHMWFNLAALHGNRRARGERREIAIEMSAYEIAAAQRLARERLTAVQTSADTLPARQFAWS